ncbi:hypothetical protein SNA_22095 [Streptomyces natalensis ATCC 27448]|uniref:Uncharacterized protein n=1 Tax=Streptomyces natalensis ATCC 27448 TaxID=1240678 RepID=A0A0D7CIS2_9ACTN|nr:hypothetical protein SNA_22095 [Streptomyces natalensis ATCC 27448]
MGVDSWEAPVMIPTSAWAKAVLMVPVTLLVAVLGIVWLIGMLVPPAREYALDIGKQTASMMRALTR